MLELKIRKDKNTASKVKYSVGIVIKGASYDNVIELSGSDANEEVEIE
jgi:hypothetical protein